MPPCSRRTRRDFLKTGLATGALAIAGGLFTEGLIKAGSSPDVQYAPATNTVAEQQNQIEAMITNGAKVIIVCAKDGSQLSTQVGDAKKAGAVVIAYDRLILNTTNVDYYVAYDNERVGELQGQALLTGMQAKYPGKKTFNIELFAGSPDDNNSGVFFQGAMKVLQPKIDDGTLTFFKRPQAVAANSNERQPIAAE